MATASKTSPLTPFVGVENAFGTAAVTITRHRACIHAKIDGFRPMAAHIHFGAIDENGDVVMDFTPLLEKDQADFDGCVYISPTLAKAIMDSPVSDSGERAI